ncbi:helix-turn-helix transcriptional regulator [Mycolicibacterium sp. XJ2]
MSAEFRIGDDLARYVREAIEADTSFGDALQDAEEARRLVDSLIAIRKQRRLTQVQLADRMGVRQPTISGFEKEPSDPKLSTLQRYARALDIRLRVVLDHCAGPASPGWKQCSTYTGSTRRHSAHTGTDKSILVNWHQGATIAARDQARVA